MKSSTQDQVEGKLHTLQGAAKEIAGKVCDNPKLKDEGVTEKLAGKVQEKIGQIKKVLGK
ncbi:MAG: CsbD family protein [Desulfobulbaceae bacterium]|nr:CsbD family protein [Desulfobulbaceae bacterium]